MKSTLTNIFLHVLFYSIPKVKISKDEKSLFDHLLYESYKRPNKIIDYNLSIPKYKFFYYVTKYKSFILHGSNNKQIDIFEPREQTLYNGEMTKAVFATKDPIWPVFYAILDKEKVVGNIRNGAVSANGTKMFHFYSLTKQTLMNRPWTTGMVYLLPEHSFNSVAQGTIHFNEWISKKPVTPVAKIAVNPDDFYFINKVASHRSNESIIKTWVLYKSRSLL